MFQDTFIRFGENVLPVLGSIETFGKNISYYFLRRPFLWP